MTANNNGERRFLWRALNVLSIILLTATLAVTGWMLMQIVELNIHVAGLTTAAESVARRLARIEKQIDAGGKITTRLGL